MEQTLKVGDRVLVNKLSYHLHGVHRGDVVVFKRPPNHPEIDAKDLIKRVIGLPGERVTIKDNQVFIDGRPLSEPYVKHLTSTDQIEPSLPRPPGCTFPDFTGIDEPPGLPTDTIVVPQGDVFVMGDNRTDSSDSRCFGPIPKKLIVGRAFLRMWPPSRIGLL
jgi:signal peptidase I